MEAACDELESAAKHIDRLTKGGNG
jgi:hypothetical protein